MKLYTILVNETELAFARELVNSKLGVTMENVETCAGFKKAVLTAKEVESTAAPSEHDADTHA